MKSKQKGFYMNITIILLLLAITGLLFLYFLRKNSETRKENLNIVKEGNRLHFFLSDDYFLSIKLEDNNMLTNDITQNIGNYIENINEDIRKISFINFKNEMLEEKLNKILKVKKS
jgi:Mg2+ and Co2+ transporter CorA